MLTVIVMQIDGYSDDTSTRWRLIKTLLCPWPAERRMAFVGAPAGGRTRHWQRRFWEHTILDDADYAAHMDYVHFNPVRHGYVPTPAIGPTRP